MPFPKTWVEELIIEWLHLDGFLVEANLPVGVKKVGGRLEADIVGSKIISGNLLEIRHIESGQLIVGTQGINAIINRKFSPSVCQSVTNYFTQRLSFTSTSSNTNYQKFYVLTYWSQPAITAVTKSNLGIMVDLLPDFICKKVLPTIKQWKNSPHHMPQILGKTVQLPDSYWLLKLIDYLDFRNMLK